MGRARRKRLLIIPGLVTPKVVKGAASSNLVKKVRRALPSLFVGVAAAALLKLIAESSLKRSGSLSDALSRSSQEPLDEGKVASNGHQETNPDRLISFQ